MSLPRAGSSAPTADVVGRWGRWLLTSGLVLGLALVLYLAWSLPEALPFVPLALLGGIALWYLFRRPLLNLCVVLALFVLTADYQAGFQATEVLYGLYYLGFLAWWFLLHLFVYKGWDEVFSVPEAKALFLFLVLITLSLPLGLLFGGVFRTAISEWAALTMLAFYFPVKEACVRYRHGAAAVLAVLLLIGTFVAVRNVVNYQAVLLHTARLGEAGGRVVTNDNLLMAASLVSLVFLTFARRWRERLVLAPFFLLFFGGLILTQSRGYWVAFAAGTLFMFVVIDGRHRRRMLALGLAGGVLLAALGAIFLGDFLLSVLDGLVGRVASLGTAVTADLSLVNRFRESAAAWEYIERNPILGHGLGVPYTFYDLILGVTNKNSFIHNGYVGLWYRFGVWGLALVLFYWARSAWHGLRAFRMQPGPSVPPLSGLAAAVVLAAFTLSTVTSNPFHLNDATFIFGVLTGLGSGAYRRLAPAPAGLA